MNLLNGQRPHAEDCVKGNQVPRYFPMGTFSAMYGIIKGVASMKLPGSDLQSGHLQNTGILKEIYMSNSDDNRKFWHSLNRLLPSLEPMANGCPSNEPENLRVDTLIGGE